MNWAEHNLDYQTNVVRVAPWLEYEWLNQGFTMAQAGNMSYRFGDKFTVDAARAEVAPDWVTMNQIHGVNVQEVVLADQDLAETDGIITDRPGLTLAVLVADCVPLLLVDPVTRRIGVAHAGRRGTFVGIAQKAVEQMVKLGSKVQDIEVAIGPSIGPCCYMYNNEPLDLWSLNEQQLRDVGVQTIIRTDVCTKHTDYFFSHQRDPQAGRFAGFINRL